LGRRGATWGEKNFDIENIAPFVAFNRGQSNTFNDAVEVIPPGKSNFGASTFD
jgi:hypothetical protein